MRIGELAQACDCPAETIRYYEKIGLLPQAVRRANGYRSYEDKHQKWLQFIIRSRELGFSQDEVRRLTDLAGDGDPLGAGPPGAGSSETVPIAGVRLADVGTNGYGCL